MDHVERMNKIRHLASLDEEILSATKQGDPARIKALSVLRAGHKSELDRANEAEAIGGLAALVLIVSLAAVGAACVGVFSLSSGFLAWLFQ